MPSRGSGGDDTQQTDAGLAIDQTVPHDASGPQAAHGPVIRATPRTFNTLGRYTIVRALGRGGMGTVYEASDPELGRNVAIKMLRDDMSSSPRSELLRREAQALARLVHPNVVSVYDVGVDFDGLFIVMQLVAGQPIDRALRGRSPREIIAAFRDAGRGLAAAHAAGLVHCDFKPSNVLVDQDGVARVTDFGIARFAADDHGTVAGTPAYMAPEQFTGVATPASDQYAFCAALYEVLVGSMPYELTNATNADAARTRIVRTIPRSTQVPRYVARALSRGMAADPAQRFPSMEALLAELAPPAWRRWALAGAIAALALTGVAIASARLSRATVAVAADAAVPVVPELADKRALTSYGSLACAYAPAFDRDDVVYDRTQGDAVDLYRLSVQGGSARQLTTSPTWEWRAHPGARAGEVTFLVTDMQDQKASQIAVLDLATATKRTLASLPAIDAALTARGIAYVSEGATELRLIEGAGDTVLAAPPNGYKLDQLAVSHRGDRVAIVIFKMPDVQLCLVDVYAGTLECPISRIIGARPAFGVDDRVLYYSTVDGIHGRTLATGEDRRVIPDAFATGGVAVAGDGHALVYSDCGAHTRLFDWTARPPRELFDDPTASSPSATSTTTMVWLHDDRGVKVLLARTATQSLRITDGGFGSVQHPAISPDGKRVAFQSGPPHPGIYTADLLPDPELQRVTDDPADTEPIWLGNDQLAFTRHDGKVPSIYVVPSIGGTARQLSTSSRTVLGNHGRELLVEGSRHLLWLDVDTGRERLLPDSTQIARIATSPNGHWLLFGTGSEGQTLFRMALDPPSKPEPLPPIAAGQTITSLAITNDGDVIVAPYSWSGDLYLVPARAGSRF